MRKKSLMILLMILLASLLLTACQPGQEAEETDQEVEENIEDQEDEATEDGLIEFVDMAGRTSTIKKNPDKIMSTDPVGTVILYTINPDKLLGWNYDLSEGEKEYIDEKYQALPNLGGAGKTPLNAEELLKLDPDFLIDISDINDAAIERMDELQDKLNKPVLMFDADMNSMDQVYRMLGEIMEEDRAEELAEFVETVMEDMNKNSGKIAEEDKKKLYYAEGPDGLETEPSNSWHSQIINLLGAENVAQVEAIEDTGKSQVNIEQLITWDPEVIISWGDERGGYYSGILEDPAWKDITAVKDGQVYEIPNRPFNWFDRPPSVNRMLGIKWLGNILYPEIYDYDMREELRTFYDIFYHYQLTEEQIDEFLK